MRDKEKRRTEGEKMTGYDGSLILDASEKKDSFRRNESDRRSDKQQLLNGAGMLPQVYTDSSNLSSLHTTPSTPGFGNLAKILAVFTQPSRVTLKILMLSCC